MTLNIQRLTRWLAVIFSEFRARSARSEWCSRGFKLLLDMRDWTFSEFPALNDAIEVGTKTPADMVKQLRPRIEIVRDHYQQQRHIAVMEARAILQFVGMWISAAERHHQADGCAPGVALRSIPKAESLLLRLGRAGSCPPRDTYKTYWIDNPGNLRFTTDPQEQHFLQAVKATDICLTSLCTAIRPLCDGVVPIESAEAVEAVERARHACLRIAAEFNSLMEPNGDDYVFSRKFFALRMRTYLNGYPIGSETWPGVNAADLPSQIQADFLIGTVDEQRRNHVKQMILPHLPDEDRAAVLADIERASLLELLLNRLGLTPEQAASIDDPQLSTLISGQPEQVRRTLCAFQRLLAAAGHAAGIHWRFIQEYLVKFGRIMAINGSAKLPVPLDRSTGNNSFDEADSIRKLRQKHPVAAKLAAAIRITENHTPQYPQKGAA